MKCQKQASTERRCSSAVEAKTAGIKTNAHFRKRRHCALKERKYVSFFLCGVSAFRFLIAGFCTAGASTGVAHAPSSPRRFWLRTLQAMASLQCFRNVHGSSAHPPRTLWPFLILNPRSELRISIPRITVEFVSGPRGTLISLTLQLPNQFIPRCCDLLCFTDVRPTKVDIAAMVRGITSSPPPCV